MLKPHNDAPQCPKCRGYHIVKQGENRWICLKCDFSKDLTSTGSNKLPLDIKPGITPSWNSQPRDNDQSKRYFPGLKKPIDPGSSTPYPEPKTPSDPIGILFWLLLLAFLIVVLL